MKNLLAIGVVALAAIAGSANAGVIDAFTVPGTGTDPRPGSPFEARELFFSSGNTGTANVNTTNNTLELANSASGSFSVQWTNWGPGGDGGPGFDWTGLQSVSFTINSTTGGSLDLTLATLSGGSEANARLRWQNFTVPVGITNVVLNVGSAYGGGTFQQQSLFDVTNVNMARLRVNSANFNGVLSNFQYNVPTPGAAALLGIAGLAATRRRR